MPLHLLKLLPPTSSIVSFVATQIKSPAVRALRLDPLSQGFREAIEALLSAFEREFVREETLYSFLQESVDASITAFLGSEAVRESLILAFTSPEEFETLTLPRLWKEIRMADGGELLGLGATFDWNQIGAAYLNSVRDIQKRSPELREVWKATTLSNIDRNLEALRGSVPVFSLEDYRGTIFQEFGTVKLSAFPAQYDSAIANPRVSLQGIFVPRLVKESFQGTQIDREDGSDIYHDTEYQSRRVHIHELSEVLTNGDKRIVIAGGPGLGKSTILSHIALDWAEKRSHPVPFVIELRKYVKDHSHPKSFEEFLENGTWSYFHISRQQLNELVRDRDSIFLFDGLDEVFDEGLRANIVSEIATFARDHPRVSTVVTTRAVGYSGRATEEALVSARFRHFFLLGFDDSQIQQFVTRWFAQQPCDGIERNELISRLMTAIHHSKSLRELASNPLLLTMMSLLNRRKPLPQERIRLYEECAEVLVNTWDASRFLDPSIYLAYDDKIEILQQVALEMQGGCNSSEPLISRPRLRSIITNALAARAIPEPIRAARKVVASLVERDYMLCPSAGEQFAFVHRTFGDYFCAKELVSHLADGVGEGELLEAAKLRWEDDSWHEVLRLVCGMVGPNLASKLITVILEESQHSHAGIFLAAECVSEVRSKTTIEPLRETVYQRLVSLIDHAPDDKGLSAAAMAIRTGAVDRLARFCRDERTRILLTDAALTKSYWAVRFRAVEGLVSQWKEGATRQWLIDHLQDTDWPGAQSAIHGLAFGWPDHDSYALIVALLKTRNGDPIITTIIETLAAYWPDIVNRKWLMDLVSEDGRHEVLWHAISEVIDRWKDDETKQWLLDLIMNDSRQEARNVAAERLAKNWLDAASFGLLQEWARQGRDVGLRQAALLALPSVQKTPATRSLLMERIDGEANDDFRSDLIQILAFHWRDYQTRSLLLNWANHPMGRQTRLTSLMVLGRFWKSEPLVQRLLAERAPMESDAENRIRLLHYIAWLLPTSPTTREMLVRMSRDGDDAVRRAVARAQKQIGDSPSMATD